MIYKNWLLFAANQNGQDIRLKNGINLAQEIQNELDQRGDNKLKNKVGYLVSKFSDSIKTNKFLKDLVEQDYYGKVVQREYKPSMYGSHLEEIKTTIKHIIEDDVWDVRCQGFIPVGEIARECMYIFDVDSFENIEIFDSLSQEIRNNSLDLTNEFGDKEWHYDEKYDSFIHEWYDPLNSDRDSYCSYNKNKKGYNYLIDESLSIIRHKNWEIDALKTEIEDLKLEIKTRKDNVCILSERDLENYLVECCDIRNWRCEKQDPKKLGIGVPDRKITKPDGTILYVELKTPTGQGNLTHHQYEYHEKLREQGYPVKVIWSKDQVDKLLNE